MWGGQFWAVIESMVTKWSKESNVFFLACSDCNLKMSPSQRGTYSIVVALFFFYHSGPHNFNRFRVSIWGIRIPQWFFVCVLVGRSAERWWNWQRDQIFIINFFSYLSMLATIQAKTVEFQAKLEEIWPQLSEFQATSSKMLGEI